jgi:hypothetical protein
VLLILFFHHAQNKFHNFRANVCWSLYFISIFSKIIYRKYAKRRRKEKNRFNYGD